MALSRGLILNTPREAAARGCRARLPPVISISLAWPLLSLAPPTLACAHARHLRLTQHARSSQEPKALPRDGASIANSRAAHDICESGGRISAHLHPSFLPLCTAIRNHIALKPSRATRSRIAPTMSPERHSRSKIVTIFSVTPTGSRVAATDGQLQHLVRNDRRQPPCAPSVASSVATAREEDDDSAVEPLTKKASGRMGVLARFRTASRARQPRAD